MLFRSKSILLLNSLYEITQINKIILNKYLGIAERLYSEVTQIYSTISGYIESLNSFIRVNKTYEDFFKKHDVANKIKAVVDFFNLSPVLKSKEKPIAHFDFIFLQRIITVCLGEDV